MADKRIMTGGKARGGAKPADAASGLVLDRLVDAAIEVLQEAGLDALSTRHLAERVGVKSPALYWHVPNKQALLALVADKICEKMKLPKAGTPYRRRLEAIAREYRRVLLAHRDSTRLFAILPPTGANRMQLYDAAVGAFRDAGLALPEAVAMATFFRHFLLGMIAEEARQRDSTHGGRPTRALGRELSNLGSASARYRNLADAAELLADIEPGRLFRMGLATLLDGMDHRIAAQRR